MAEITGILRVLAGTGVNEPDGRYPANSRKTSGWRAATGLAVYPQTRSLS